MNAAIVGVRRTLELTSGTVGFVTAISLIGAATGVWFAGPVAGRVGRNRVMLLAGSAILVGSVGAALSSAVALIGGCRVVTGLGIGAASAVVPRGPRSASCIGLPRISAL